MEARQSKLAKKVLVDLEKQGRARKFMKYVKRARDKNRGESVEYDNEGKKYYIKKI
ncbi:MAG TPA: hypothetical protein VJ912_03500 [Candidatus Nanoarchaeia archaeon]|nr:hypothetical protein [Candidatus Nanoarchaeia archaeon]